MIRPQLPANEAERLTALNNYHILDTLPEADFDAITRIASEICQVPVALISLVDPDRQWFKSHHGLDATETPRELAFCAHAINDPDNILIVPDAQKDDRFHDNPLSTGGPNVVFYAGAPLNTPEGYSIGTLCVIDNQPRELTESQQKSLTDLANQVVSQLELRKRNRQLEKKQTEILQINSRLEAFGHRLAHDLKTPIRGIQSVVNWIEDDYAAELDPQVLTWLTLIDSRAEYMRALTDGLLNYSKALKTEINFERFQPQELLAEIRSLFPKTKPWNLTVSGSPGEILHFKAGFFSIFQNLVSNSLKFCDKPTCEIYFHFSTQKEEYEIIYEDNGPGIAPENRKKVFELFETIGQKTPESTGIGLATVSAIVETLNGTILLEDSQKGETGVRFVITLPLTP